LIQIYGIKGIPLIREGDNLGHLIFDATQKQGLKLLEEDVVVVAQKIVSKAEGKRVNLDEVKPSRLALNLSKRNGKDPRLLEIILTECGRIVKMKGNHLITQVGKGHICANSGVDTSNVEEGFVTVLPTDPDGSADRLRDCLEGLAGVRLAVIISDTCGRPFRKGQVNLALGLSGIKSIKDYRGLKDMFGRPLSVTMIAVADELASAAELVMEKAEQVPVAVIRGYRYEVGGRGARDLIRPPSKDLFAS
jgi:coenzyme F420-0:L-glutamate ligase/coenzyme F420-1:gamma-L-glutamate ligase